MCTTSFISRNFSKGVKIELTTNIDIENNCFKPVAAATHAISDWAAESGYESDWAVA